MFERPILVYSNYCNHSQNFLQVLMKHPDIFESFIRMNIDVDPKTKQRPTVFYQVQQTINQKISRVPTIIITDTNKQLYVLSDKEAFKWLDYEIKSKQDDSLQPYNPNEMTSFSDNYSKVGSTHLNDATEQNFKFFQDGKLPSDNNFTSLQEKDTNQYNQSDNDYTNKQTEREQFDTSRQQQFGNLGRMEPSKEQFSNQPKVNDSEYNMRLNAYNTQSQNQQPTPTIDFTSRNFGLSAEIAPRQNVTRESEKQKELDMRLQQLMDDRR